MNLDSSFDLKFEPSKQEDIENNFKGLQSAVDCFSSLSPIRL